MNGPDEPRPVTVAMLTHNYLPAVGGAERQLNSLNPLFIAGGITPIVYTRSRPGLPATEFINGARVIRVPCIGPGPVKSIMFVVGTLWRLTRLKPDVVHAYDTLTPSLVAGLHRLVSGTPYVTKLLRSGELGDLTRLAGKPLGRARLALLRRSVSRFVAISRDLESELADRGVDDNRRVFIPNGVDTERFRPLSDSSEDTMHPDPSDAGTRWERRRQLFPDWPLAPVVVVVGRLSPEKRVVELARQWKRILDRVPNEAEKPWLHVIGEGPLDAELDGIDHVRLLGRREDMPEILRWSDVYVSASSAEGLSNALLEAMASGCPCVVTDVGGVSDVMTNGVDGVIVAPEDANRPVDEMVIDLLGRVENLLADPSRRIKLGAAARRTVVERYSLNSTAEALIAQYRDLARRAPSTAPTEREVPGR